MASGKIIVKMKESDASADENILRLESFLHDYDVAIKPLFPNETDKELATIFVVELEGKEHIKSSMETLSGQTEVEYAHTPAAREPM